MKVNDLKKIIREEVTKVVRKELVGFVKLLGESNKPKTTSHKSLTECVLPVATINSSAVWWFKILCIALT